MTGCAGGDGTIPLTPTCGRSDRLGRKRKTSSRRHCLTLIVACIVYWQAREISRMIRECDPEAAGVDLSLLEHVSPIEWDNVVLYGQYVLNRKLIKRRRAVA